MPSCPSVVGTNLANYTVVPANGTLSITQAPTSVSLGSSSTIAGTGTPVVLTAVVSSTSAGTPTGSVSFFDGGTQIGTAIAMTGNTATLSTSFNTVAVHSITAVYSSDTNFAASTSAAISVSTLTPGYSVTANPTTLTITRGSTGTATITLTPFGNYKRHGKL